MSGAGLIRLISRLGDVISRSLSRRKFLAAGILGAAGLGAAGCGTIMHPERRGQPAGPIDWKVVALDGIGLFLFFVPGVIAFAVDFATGAIYLPPEQYSSAAAPAKTPLVSVEVPRERLNQAEIGSRSRTMYRAAAGSSRRRGALPQRRGGQLYRTYMRRRDPDCMVVADERPTDKPRFDERFGGPFADREQIHSHWLAEQDLVVVPFMAGGPDRLRRAADRPGQRRLLRRGLADLQGMIAPANCPRTSRRGPSSTWRRRSATRTARPAGRRPQPPDEVHELFSLNLYPGPSAKKGIYGVLLNHRRARGLGHRSTARPSRWSRPTTTW
jgi:hypothetical protein